jgi:hypothetical protein
MSQAAGRYEGRTNGEVGSRTKMFIEAAGKKLPAAASVAQIGYDLSRHRKEM